MAAVEKTVTIKITPKLAALVAEKYATRPLSELYATMEPWVKKTYKSALVRAMKGDFARVDVPTVPGRTAIIRIDRSQARRLLIVAPVYGRMVGDMIEEKLWELLA